MVQLNAHSRSRLAFQWQNARDLESQDAKVVGALCAVPGRLRCINTLCFLPKLGHNFAPD